MPLPLPHLYSPIDSKLFPFPIEPHTIARPLFKSIDIGNIGGPRCGNIVKDIIGAKQAGIHNLVFPTLGFSTIGFSTLGGQQEFSLAR